MPNRYLLFLALGMRRSSAIAAAQRQIAAARKPSWAIRLRCCRIMIAPSIHFDRALKQDPTNTLYRLKSVRLRALDGQYHVQQGQKYHEEGRLADGAL